MDERKYMLQLKKILRELIKEYGQNDLKRHITIIKQTLFFISQIILIKIKFDISEPDKLLKKSEDGFNEHFSLLLEGINPFDNNSTKKSQSNNSADFLDSHLKLKIIYILNHINKDNLTQFSLGELYDQFTTNNEKKLLGQVYTPKDVVEEMITSSLREEDIITNPYMKVIDIACGGGYFLIAAFHRIKEIIIMNYDEIILNEPNVKGELKCGIDMFIVKNNIWGLEIDEFSVYMTRFSLCLLGETTETNIFKMDTLLDDDSRLIDASFGLVVTNPPYIGHKKLEKLYRSCLALRYSDVFSDKGDISYCFFKRAYELLEYDGRLCFITSRYFLESLSAKELRRFINTNFTIEKIMDFHGENIFKGIGISPAIIECRNNKHAKADLKVYKRTKNNKTDSFKENITNNFIEFYIVQEHLKDDGWVLLDLKQKTLFDKIDNQGEVTLDELCTFKQGIITGLDKAFIIDRLDLDTFALEEDIIKPWIKNSEIDKFFLKEVKKYIIYTDNIKVEEDYTNTLKRLEEFKEKLLKRRECVSEIRKWYQLQWGRDENLFKMENIMFPYKSNSNKFAIVRDEIYSSADIYSITIKESAREIMSLEYLVAFLNSTICEFYFKCIAKKLNDKLYEYYPNKLIQLQLKLTDNRESVQQLVKEMEKLKQIDDSIHICDITREIDSHFYKLYELDESEINLIETTLKGDYIYE